MLEKIDLVQIDESDRSAMHFSFPPAPQAGKVVLEVRDTEKSYGEKKVFSEASFALLKGEKIAFVGRNGEGKTTMAKMIMNQTDFLGEIVHGYNVSIGYYAQNHAEFLDHDKTVFQTIDDIATGDVRMKIRQLLGSFLFSGEAIDKKVKVLSGGEKSRLALVTLLLRPVNLLILDEPTNHLDMLSKDILKNALLRYDGALIVVSHDRDFLQGLTSKVIEFRSGRVREYLGDIYDFLESRRISDLNELNKISALRSSNLSESKGNRDYEQRKAAERARRKVLNAIQKCENEISLTEKNISDAEQRLNDTENFKEQIASGELFRAYEALKVQLSQLLEKWEQLHCSLEEAGEISDSESEEIESGKNK
jgi:ATP-binding cassette, subfamily F, member 3